MPYPDPPEWTRHYDAAISRGVPPFIAAAMADDVTFGDCRDPSPLDFDNTNE
jgi:hypothetical protein